MSSNLEKEIVEALGIRPHSEAIKRVFWGLIGFDRIADSYPPHALGFSQEDEVSAIEIFGEIEDFKLLKVRLRGLAEWNKSLIRKVTQTVVKAWPDSLLLLVDSTDTRWVVARMARDSGRISSFPLFDDPKYSASQLARIARQLDSPEDLSTFEVDAAVSEGFNANRCDALMLKWLKEINAPASSAVDLWFKTMTSVPLFTPDQERDAFRNLEEFWPHAERGAIYPLDGQAGPQFSDCVLRNLRLVAWMAYKYRDDCRYSNELIDFLQEGTLGLMRAIRRFEASRGHRFTTYAFYWVRQTITRYRDDTTHTIRTPVHMVEHLRRMYRVRRQLTLRLSDAPNENELAEELELPIDKVRLLLNLPRARMGISGGDDMGNLNQALMASSLLSPTEAAEESVIRDYLDRFLGDILSSKAKRVICGRFGLFDGKALTLQELGDEFGITREGIRQIEVRALRKLRLKRNSRFLEPLVDPAAQVAEDVLVPANKEIKKRKSTKKAGDTTKSEGHARPRAVGRDRIYEVGEHVIIRPRRIERVTTGKGSSGNVTTQEYQTDGKKKASGNSGGRKLVWSEDHQDYIAIGPDGVEASSED